MTRTEKEHIIKEILELLIKLATDDCSEHKQEHDIQENGTPQHDRKVIEMLTINECVKLLHGVSKHSIRTLVASGKIKSSRIGEGKNGRILINKDDLLAYFNV